MEVMKQALLTILRNKNTDRAEFRVASEKLALILAQEAAEYVKTKKIKITTPLGQSDGIEVESEDIILVPILRSGLGLLPAFIQYFPKAKVGFVGLQRDEKTAIAHLYYKKIPKMTKSTQVIMLDPMIATGGSACDTLDILINELGITQEQILFVAIICSTDGLKRVKDKFPKIKITVVGEDKELNKHKFIVPGLGDFGDRYFGTEE